jgi:hypothetical protein
MLSDELGRCWVREPSDTVLSGLVLMYRKGAMERREPRETIVELKNQQGGDGQPPRRGKLDVMIERTNSVTVAGFARQLLSHASNEAVLELVGISRPDPETEDWQNWQKKVESFARQLLDQIEKEKLNRRDSELPGFRLGRRAGSNLALRISRTV